jgi:hypothetical protein
MEGNKERGDDGRFANGNPDGPGRPTFGIVLQLCRSTAWRLGGLASVSGDSVSRTQVCQGSFFAPSRVCFD